MPGCVCFHRRVSTLSPSGVRARLPGESQDPGYQASDNTLPAACRAADASGDEAAALQERALWDLLALFFLEAQQAQQGLSAAHDLARWLRTNAAAVAAGCRAAAHPLPPRLVEELREAALPEAHPAYWACLQVGCLPARGGWVVGPGGRLVTSVALQCCLPIY